MNTQYLAHAKQIADALEPIRAQAVASLSQVLTDAGRDASVLRPDSDGDLMIRAHQALSMIAFFAQPPKYIPRSEFQEASGYILVALNGLKQPRVEESAKMLIKHFPDLSDRAGFVAGVLYGLRAGEEIGHMLRIMAAVLTLMGLSTQQVVAMSFNDSKAINELQQEKLRVQAALTSGM
jgi:hypothetical protein